MKRVTLLLPAATIVVLMIIVMSCAQNRSRVAKADIKSKKGFVVMELFTSQGCSSCPAADELLGQYAKKNDAHIIPLAFHVDYWNRLGWVDSFSTESFTNRQRYYASKFDVESIYTPQVVLNGQKEMVGNDEASIATAIENFLKEPETISIDISNKMVDGKTVKISYSLNKLLPKSSINAVLVQADVVTQIKAGENRGTKLDNYNIVRDLNTATVTNTIGNIELQLPRGSMANGFSVVLFVQDNESGKIIGAVKSAL